MTLYSPLTDSINGEVTYSGGQHRTNYERRSSQWPTGWSEHRNGTTSIGNFELVALGHLTGIQPSENHIQFGVAWGKAQTISPLELEYRKKRFLTCVAALLMPPEGVNENLESTLDILRFHHEQARYDVPTIAAAPLANYRRDWRNPAAAANGGCRLLSETFEYQPADTGGRLMQGEIICDIQEIRPNLAAVSASGEMSEFLSIVHQKVIVITPDCDLLSDYSTRSNPASDERQNQARLLEHIQLCDVYPEQGNQI